MSSAMTCFICQEDYNGITRRPTGFLCGHTICSCCVKRTLVAENDPIVPIFKYLFRQTIVPCPICRKMSDIPKGGLPTNILALRLLPDRKECNDCREEPCYCKERKERSQKRMQLLHACKKSGHWIASLRQLAQQQAKKKIAYWCIWLGVLILLVLLLNRPPRDVLGEQRSANWFTHSTPIEITDLQSPWDVAVSPVSGNIIITDDLTHSVHILNRRLHRIRIFGRRGTGNGEYRSPRGVAADKSERIYVADMLNHRIQVHNSKGAFLYSFGGHGSENSKLKNPMDIVIDQNNNLFVCDSENYRISIFSQEGRYLESIPDLGFKPRYMGMSLSGSLVLSGLGDIYMAEKSILPGHYSLSQLSYTYSANGITADTLSGNIIAVSRKRVTLLNSYGYLIRDFTIEGNTLQSPKGIAITSEGNILICENTQGHVGKIVVISNSFVTDRSGQVLRDL